MPIDYFVWAIKGASRDLDRRHRLHAPSRASSRGRNFIRCPSEGLKALDIDPDRVEDVIITHMHYDHCRQPHALPARALPRAGQGDVLRHRPLHVPRRCSGTPTTSRTWCRWCAGVYDGRAAFHDGDEDARARHQRALRRRPHHGPADGARLDAARLGGARLRRGHYYANMEQARPFPIVYNVADMLEGHKRAYALADSPRHVIPGHDPLVLKRYPAPHPRPAGHRCSARCRPCFRMKQRIFFNAPYPGLRPGSVGGRGFFGCFGFFFSRLLRC